jgi:23S rRNA (cytidine1920-2'-O)/16S rRNA (cytidine1409-2'-O)-methyltransferase
MKRERLDVLLVNRGLVQSRARAAARILAGDVVVNDHRVDKPGTQVLVDALIRLKGADHPWVSRGGQKLTAALDAWPIVVAGVVAVDVGASTGGFTDVLLSRGARHVFAVDVGWGQLHERLRQDGRVTNLERTHIGRLPVGSLSPLPSMAVIDVSFISLRLVLPALLPHLLPPADIVALVKPQFEVGRGQIGKGGIVRDEGARKRAVDDVVASAQSLGLVHGATIPSPIEGADGNVEFLAWFRSPSATGDGAHGQGV